MGQGQKGSSDQKEGKKKWDESPAPEDGHKCRVCRFPLLIALLQLLLGAAVTAVAFFMLAVSPSLLTRETPYWAGIIVSFTLTSYISNCIHTLAWSLILPHGRPCRCTCCPIFITLHVNTGPYRLQQSWGGIGKSLVASCSNKVPSVIFTRMDALHSTIRLSHNSLLGPSVVFLLIPNKCCTSGTGETSQRITP